MAVYPLGIPVTPMTRAENPRVGG